MTHYRRIARIHRIAASALIGLLAACAAGPPAATPPVVRTWTSSPVLINFGVYHERSAPIVGATPDLILYADGRLIVRGDAGLQETTLSRQEICALLNTIEQTGFLSYDPAHYREEIRDLRFFLVSRTEIVVNAWSTSRGSYPALWEFANVKEGEQINPALRAVFRLLSAYRPAGLRPHVPERIAVGLLKLDMRHASAHPWPAGSASLADLYRSAIANPRRTWDELRGAIVNRDQLQIALDALGSSLPIFSDASGEQYAVSARPLLPYESIHSALTPEPVIPSPDMIVGAMQMTCSSADGVLDIP